MVATRSTLTLFTALLLALAAPAAANASPDAGLAHRGEHQRMIKRYNSPLNRRLLESIFGPAPGAINAAPDPNGSTDADSDEDTLPGQQSPANSGASTPTPSATRGGGLGGIIGGALGGGNSDGADASSTTPTETGTTPTQTSTTPPVIRTTPTITPTPPPASTPTVSSDSQVTSIVFAGSPEEQEEQEIKEKEKQSRIPPHVVTILIVVGSTIGGLALIWTLVRKWKFRASRSFQDRLAPIDWQPTKKEDSLAPPMLENDNASIRRNMFAPDDAPALAPPPHDFTAVPGGYRTASPMPNPYGRASPAPPMALYRAPSNGSGRGYDPARGY
ncbi:hypothetical protein AURDEDRAFT_114064 [Auricularia subglabra TFB-10046 SS5]|nr:hypothetical protein AURDEDRAFT_114064 [Auricularia subglabra TFB-10046 SS5]